MEKVKEDSKHCSCYRTVCEVVQVADEIGNPNSEGL